MGCGVFRVSAVADKLREARALIERGWTQGADARDLYGDECSPNEEEAECYCANGAICRAFYAASFTDRREQIHIAEGLLNTAIGQEPGGPLHWPYIDWNDAPERTQAEVLAAFDRAIEIAEAQQ